MKSKIKNWVIRCGKLSLGCKLMVVLLLFTHFAFSSENAFGQQTITVQFEKQSLSEVLQVLKQKTGFEFHCKIFKGTSYFSGDGPVTAFSFR